MDNNVGPFDEAVSSATAELKGKQNKQLQHILFDFI